MVQFNKHKTTCSVSVEIENIDRSGYIETIKAMLFFMHTYNPQAGDCIAETYYICNLIKSMLPDEDQLINKEDVALFEKFKKQVKKIITDGQI